MPAPYQPFNVVLQTGNGQNFLLWPLVLGATSYSVQRSTDGLTFISVGTSVSPSYLDASVSIGVSYYYQVAAVGVGGTSAYSASYPLSIVPCLPGQINLGYLRYMSQLRADKLNSEYLTVDEWNFNINQSADELYDILVSKYGDDYFFAPPLLIQLTGLDYYPLPDGANYSAAPACYKLNGVDTNPGGGTGIGASWVPLARFNWSDRDKYTTWPNQAGAISNVYQMGYREMGSNLHLIPANQNFYIRLWYVPVRKQMLQDVDMLPFSISGWSEYIINDAAMKGMIKEESLEKWNALSAAKAALLTRIESIASNRDVGQPNSVSNTRSSMGDPGFGGVGSSGNGFGGGWGGM